MARDKCADCKGDFPFGAGLKDGRCPSCLAGFKERRAEARKAVKSAAAAKPAPKPEPEAEPEPTDEPAEGEEEE